MISKPRYEPRRIGETKVWRIFDTFVQEWAQPNEYYTLQAVARATNLLNRTYEDSLLDHHP